MLDPATTSLTARAAAAGARLATIAGVVLAVAAGSVALAGCGDDADDAANGTTAVMKVVEPSTPPTEGSAKAKAIKPTSTCSDYADLSKKDRAAAAFYVTKKADTNQAGFAQWRKLIDDWCKRQKGDPELIEFLKPFVKSAAAKAANENQ